MEVYKGKTSQELEQKWHSQSVAYKFISALQNCNAIVKNNILIKYSHSWHADVIPHSITIFYLKGHSLRMIYCVILVKMISF